MTHIRLLQICVEGNTGSTGTIAESIGQFVINHGGESFIAFGRYPRPSSSELIKIGNNFDLICHGLQTRIIGRHGLGSKQATKHLINKILEIRPNIIQLHHIHGYYINYQILFEFLRYSNIPVVWIFHDCWAFTGHCTYFERVACEKWKSECLECPQTHEYPRSLFFDRSQEDFRLKKALFTSIPNLTIISVSKWLNKLVDQSFLKEVKHTHIYNGIDTTFFSPSVSVDYIKSKHGLHGKFIILGVATTWDKRKGLLDFVELSKYLLESEVILLVGLSQDQIEALPDNIIGLPRTDNRSELVDLYSAADVFANLSVEETFGLTTVEAMSCGTPVVVYDSSASPELVSNETGIVVPRQNIQSVLKALRDVKFEGKHSYSSNCRSHVIDKFNSQDRHLDYYNLYLSLISSNELLEN